MTDELTYAEKINAMLDSAQQAETETERDAWMARVQRFITKYSVSESMLAAARGQTAPEPIVFKNVEVIGVLRSTWYLLICRVADVNGCRVVTNTQALTRDRKHTYRSTVIGLERDVDATLRLVGSLRAQGDDALTTWWLDSGYAAYGTPMWKHKQRREFVRHFIDAAYGKLERAAGAGRRDAVADQVTNDVTAAQAETSTALVLRSIDDRISDAIGERFGKTRYIRSRQDRGGASAANAGRKAGTAADIGQRGLGGARRELP